MSKAIPTIPLIAARYVRRESRSVSSSSTISESRVRCIALPGSKEWTPLSWEDAIERMARLIKNTRDTGFEVKDSMGRLVNRLTNTAIIGGCTDTNEVNYLLGKFRFGLGIVAYENQARL